MSACREVKGGSGGATNWAWPRDITANSIQNAASNALNTATGAASSVTTAAANITGLTPSTSAAAKETHSHAEEPQSTHPVDATAGEVIKMDTDGLAVFEDKDVRHEVLVKINQLAM